MLIGDIISECIDELGEVPGTEGYRNYPQWLTHIGNTMDEICRFTRCLYDTFRAPVTADQAIVASGGCSFCPVFKITEARLTLASGAVVYLALSLPQQARWFGGYWQVPIVAPYGSNGYDWRDAVSVIQPVALVTGGTNELRLFPAPNYSDPFIVVNSQNVYATRSLAITGYATPIPPANQYGQARANWLETDAFPLADHIYDAVKQGTKLRRMQSYRKVYSPQERQDQQIMYENARAFVNTEARGTLTGVGNRIGVSA